LTGITCTFIIKNMKAVTPLISMLLFTSPTLCEDQPLARLFENKKVEGTIVISELNGPESYVHNELRAREPFVPASTFKILNTLIALEEGVISERETIKWDGEERSIQAWNRDQTIETAFKSSCVWFYQELARRVGTAKYASYLKKIGYGTGTPSPELTTFWLEGDLKLNALEQIEFLKRVYKEELPFRKRSFKFVKRVMIVEETPEYTIRAKSGWGQGIGPQIGWYIGYVESKKGVWFFATNIEISKPEDAPLRQQITLEVLRQKGII
jgi:beta-lactamase class D